MTGSPTEEAALRYAELGIPVFPTWWTEDGICACGVACDSPGKHPLTASGFKDATSNSDTVRRWWKRYPKANVAGVCGKESGHVVLDVDPRHGGDGSFSKLEKKHGPLPPSPRAKTGGDGSHFFFAHPGGTVPPAVGFRPGLDLRGDGSYVLLPPSGHVSGGVYAWEVALKDMEAPLVPAWLLKVAESRPARKKASLGKEEPIPEGHRNVAMASLAGHLRRAGASEVALLAQLHEENAARCHPPLSDAELEAIARSISRYEPEELKERKPQDLVADLAAQKEVKTMDLDKALATIARVLRPVDPRDSFSILAYGAQGNLVDILESVFYLGFKGPTGSGKGTGVEAATALIPGGEVLGATTEAYLATVLDEGKSIGIEEADQLLKKNPAIAALLRNGYRRGVFYGFKVPVEGKKWETARRSLFGPKAFDFHSFLDPHLLGRTLVVAMRPENDVNLALDAEHKGRHLAPVLLWLKAKAEEAKSNGWSRERVAALWDTPEFRQRVARLGGKAGRDHVIGANLLLICDAYGWNYEAEIRRLVADRKTLQEFSDEAEVAEEILTWWRESGGPGVILPTESLLFRINDRRASLKLRSMTPQRHGAILRDLGFEKGPVSDPEATWVTEKKGEQRNKSVLRPHALIQELTRLTHLTHLDSQTGSGNGQDGQDGQATIEGSTDSRNFRPVPREDLQPGRCPRCNRLADLTREDVNGKRFCEACFEAMTGGSG